METLSSHELRLLLNAAMDILLDESNVPNVPLPVTICGDIHGQFPDLLNLLACTGGIGTTGMHYTFLGDLVDRGFNSVEVLSFLLLMKVKYPRNITLIRGNHETRQLTATYGFYDECKRKFNTLDVWRQCMEMFDCMPVAALIEGRGFCVHGGLSPQVHTIDHIRLLTRRQEIPAEGALSDLLWSDPSNTDGWVVSQRGAGHLFGGDVAREFLYRNSLNLMARAHQLVREGFIYHFEEEYVCTVWSAPNYCYRCGNLASVLRVYEDESREFVVFREVEQQYDPGSLDETQMTYFF